ncbi:MAG: nitrite reductase [Planctomycetes bacterium GWF2_50_10]|nr:MAG: nitrite reductase [Planctomycetes bacterium GWF2_50_10]
MKINFEISRRMQIVIYVLILLVVTVATIAIASLLNNIRQRKMEAQCGVFEVVKLTEDTVDPNQWGKNYPRQFDAYKATVDIQRTKHGGSEAFDKLEVDPRWKELFKGYSFSADYREERGHAYMLSDQDMTLRVKNFKQTGACLHCHASVIPVYRKAGKETGVPDDQFAEQIHKGFETISAMPYADARKLVTHPVACIDCHNPDGMAVRVTRPGFISAIAALADSNYPMNNYPSIEHWRKGNRGQKYDANKLASRQEMRSFVCGQCHVEYYFKGSGKLVTYAWANGLKAQQVEKYYDDANFSDWTHPDTSAKLLKAQHPEFELWNQGIHARSGVACADCHMPYKREGAIKISDHHVRSPLLNISRSCQTCHRYPESELLARAQNIQDKTIELLSRAENAVLDLIKAIQAAKAAGASDAQLETARQMHRRAQWRLDYISAENSTGFHASQESARLLAEAIDYARQGQNATIKR